MYLDLWLLDCNFLSLTHARDVGPLGKAKSRLLPVWLLMSQYVSMHVRDVSMTCLQIAVTFSPEQAFPYYQARLHLAVPGMQDICWDIQVSIVTYVDGAPRDIVACLAAQHAVKSFMRRVCTKALMANPKCRAQRKLSIIEAQTHAMSSGSTL